MKNKTARLIVEKWRGVSYPDTVHPSKLDDYDPNKLYKKGDEVTYKGRKKRVIHVHGNDSVDAVTGKKVKLKGHLNIQEAEEKTQDIAKSTKYYKDEKGRKYYISPKTGKKIYWVDEGKIKELDTAEKEEKRLGKPVMSKDQRSSLDKLKAIAKYSEKKDKK